MILLIASEKGGTGKTTIATNLAICRAMARKEVLLVDADPQGSASDFIAVRELEKRNPRISCVSISGKTSGQELEKLTNKFDDIIVDVGGRDTAALRSCLLVSDVLIMPMLPGQFDTWSAEHMDSIVHYAKDLNDKLKSFAVLNKVDTNPKITMPEDTIRAVAALDNIQILENVRIGYRLAFRKASAEGSSVFEALKPDPKAIQEMHKLYIEVFGNDKK